MGHFIDLLIVFTIREIKTRYRGALLGPLWVVLYPLALTGVTTMVFSVFLHRQIHAIPFPVFALSGFVFWSFFTNSISFATKSLIWNRDLVTKTRFPRLVIPLSMVFARLVDLIISLIVFLCLVIITHTKIQPQSVLIFLFFIFQVLFTCGISVFFALLRAMFRDVEHILDFVLLLWFYITPIAYPESVIPTKYAWLISINPMATYISIYRRLLFSGDILWNFNIIYTLVISIIIFTGGILFFLKTDKKIDDFI